MKFFGVKIDVYGTVASHHGTAAVVIDGGTRTVVTYKAASGRTEVDLEQPLLPNHFTRSSVSVLEHGCVVTADRFDVTQSDAFGRPRSREALGRVPEPGSRWTSRILGRAWWTRIPSRC